MYQFITDSFGLNLTTVNLSWLHYVTRAFLVFFVGFFLMRLRAAFEGISTPFSNLLNFALGSLLATAITSEGVVYFQILSMVLLLSLINWAIALLCLYSPFIDRLVRGREDVLVRHGRIIWENMRKHLVSLNDLRDEVFEATGSKDLSQIRKASFVTGGKIVVVKENKRKSSWF